MPTVFAHLWYPGRNREWCSLGRPGCPEQDTLPLNLRSLSLRSSPPPCKARALFLQIIWNGRSPPWSRLPCKFLPGLEYLHGLLTAGQDTYGSGQGTGWYLLLRLVSFTVRAAPVPNPDQFIAWHMNLSCQKTWHLMPEPLSKADDSKTTETFKAA